MNNLNVRPLRILAADDSAVMRGVMWKLFQMHAEDVRSELPRMELCGVAQDGVECLESVARLDPDVLVLDLEMPRLNGLEVLDRLRKERPTLPVIMCSAYTENGARSTLEALARGASDYVTKPTQQRDVQSAMQSLSLQLLPRLAALSKGIHRETSGAEGQRAQETATSPGRDGRTASEAPIEIVVIGLSTGGPTALEQLLPRLPKSFPVPIMIVQHMPKLFTRALAERLDRTCALRVEEAYEGAGLRPGTVWLAPGDSHMEVAPRCTMPGEDRRLVLRGGRVRLHQQRPLNHCMPAVDYLFFSAARMYGAGVLALVMTGMGADGVDGSRAVYEKGGVVLAQDEATSAVWGMPGRVSEAGIASATLPLQSIAAALMQRTGSGPVGNTELKIGSTITMTGRREVSYGLY